MKNILSDIFVVVFLIAIAALGIACTYFGGIFGFVAFVLLLAAVSGR